METSPFLLLVGSIALDSIFTSHGNHENLLGGSTTYALISAGRFARTHVVGVVGTDFPPEGLAVYQQFSADLTDLKTLPGNTFRWGGLYHLDQDERETLFTELGVFADFQPELSPVNRSPAVVFLANIHPELQLAVLDQIEGDPLVIVDTMNLWISTTREALDRVLKRTSILLLNESEAHLLTDHFQPDDAAADLLTRGPKQVVIKLGSQGSVYYAGSEKISMGVYPVKQVVDATGAGDSFGGGFAAALLQGKSIRQAMALGSSLASFTVEDFGITRLAQAATPEIQERLTYLLKRDWG
ncbi:MAG: sugar kinase [Candidatus Neomarinimicrobiota bacterium]|nr:MAG: sugar kinase [Candidatus Neomarinimicrobiota bacterium]